MPKIPTPEEAVGIARQKNREHVEILVARFGTGLDRWDGESDIYLGLSGVSTVAIKEFQEHLNQHGWDSRLGSDRNESFLTVTPKAGRANRPTADVPDDVPGRCRDLPRRNR